MIFWLHRFFLQLILFFWLHRRTENHTDQRLWECSVSTGSIGLGFFTSLKQASGIFRGRRTLEVGPGSWPCSVIVRSPQPCSVLLLWIVATWQPTNGQVFPGRFSYFNLLRRPKFGPLKRWRLVVGGQADVPTMRLACCYNDKH